MIGKDTAAEDVLLGAAADIWRRRPKSGSTVERRKLTDARGRKYKVKITVESFDE